MRPILKILVPTIFSVLIAMTSTCKEDGVIISGKPAKKAVDSDNATGSCLNNTQSVANGGQFQKVLFKPDDDTCSQKTEISCTCNAGVTSCPGEENAQAQGFTQAQCPLIAEPPGNDTGDGEEPPPSTPSSGLSSHILGLYDNAGEHLLAAGGQDRGWVLVNRHLMSDKHTGVDAIALDLISRGFGVITRLNWDFEGAGTIPAPGSADETTMLNKINDMVSQTPAAKVWIIGNEPNRAAESFDSQAIPPQVYASFFNRARNIIKGIAGHENDIVMPAALAPASGDYNTTQYFNEMMQHIPAFDAIAVHAKPDSGMNGFFLFNEGDAITTHAKAAGKWIFVTEANPKGGWQNGTHDTWVSQAIQKVKEFNDRGSQKIIAMVVYRFNQGQRSEENISGRTTIESDFKNAANLNITWR